ncbi:MAG: putative metal-binding motif-containing protein [Deltaproteobacteria bacterium]|nr:putative metal-binding motif-containing protein [Deltaproteobacteria bacterium]
MVALVASGVLAAGRARAEDLVVPAGGEVMLGGDHLFDKVTVKGTLLVKRYDQAQPDGAGWLRIGANTIVIEAGGAVDATGKGYRGGSGAAQGHDNGAGAGKTASGPMPRPGGGGAHLKKGGDAYDKGCTVAFAATGGSAYDDDKEPLADAEPQQGMGSAGGTAAASEGLTVAGGDGGGVIVLRAAKIVLQGRLLANGDDAAPGPSAGFAGGGAGGTIIVEAGEFSAGADARCAANGGKGHGDAQQALGGSGSGGLIVLRVQGGGTSLPKENAEVVGGAAVQGCAGTKGEDGTFKTGLAECPDADGDGHANAACRGDDCDDLDPERNPGQEESCNGIDDDCDGKTDDAPGLCGAGMACKQGSCVPAPDAGDAGPAALPPRIVLGGGLCAVRPGRGPGLAGGLLLLGLMLAASCRRWARR